MDPTENKSDFHPPLLQAILPKIHTATHANTTSGHRQYVDKRGSLVRS